MGAARLFGDWRGIVNRLEREISEDRFSVMLHEVVGQLTERERAVLNAAVQPLLAAIQENIEHSVVMFNRLSK